MTDEEMKKKIKEVKTAIDFSHAVWQALSRGGVTGPIVDNAYELNQDLKRYLNDLINPPDHE